jgi:hypothetical protein
MYRDGFRQWWDCAKVNLLESSRVRIAYLFRLTQAIMVRSAYLTHWSE